MNKSLFWIGIVVVIVIIIATVMSGIGQAPTGSGTKGDLIVEVPPYGEAATQAPAAPVAASVKEFTIIGSNYSFAPATLTVKQGDTVTIIFKNNDGFHDLKIDEFQAATKQIKAGAEDSITFIADKAGTFEYYCSVGKHRQMGMKGTLIVE